MLAARLAAIASLGAAMIHLAATPTHWREWLLSGLFFASISVFQLMWAFRGWTRPTALLLMAGIVVNAGSAALWVLSRTAGAPFGPHAGETESVQAAGICVLMLECYVVMGAGWAWYRGHRADQVSGFGRALVLLGANAVIAAAATVGVVSSLQHHDHHAPAEAQREDQAPHAVHKDGHPHHSEFAAPPDTRVTEPPAAPSPAEPELRPMDMEHHTDGDHHHDE